MRKVGILFMAVLLMLSLFGCAAKNGDNLPIIETPKEPSYPEIDGFIHAEYEKLNCSAIENGLAGTRIYEDVLLKEIIIEQESILLLVENADANQYLVATGTYPFYSEALLEPLIGSYVRIFFEYVTYSEEHEMPLCYLYPYGKLELSSGTVYTSDNFKASREQFKAWVAEYCQVIEPDQIGEYEAMSVMLTGYATDVSCSDTHVNLRVKGSSASSYEEHDYSLLLNNFPVAKDIEEGTGVMMYGFIQENKFHPVYLEFREPDFALDKTITG